MGMVHDDPGSEGSDRRAGARERLRRLLVRSQAKQQIVARIAEGLHNGQIAEAIGRTEHNVHSHVQQVYDTVGVHSRVVLAGLFHQLRERGDRS